MAGKKSKIGKSVFSILVVLAVLLGAVYAANIANFRVNLHYKTGAVDIQMDVKKDGETVESASFDNLAPASRRAFAERRHLRTRDYQCGKPGCILPLIFGK